MLALSSHVDVHVLVRVQKKSLHDDCWPMYNSILLIENVRTKKPKKKHRQKKLYTGKKNQHSKPEK